MARKVRKDTKGRILHKGETYLKNKGLYCYAYTYPLGKRHYVYAPDLPRFGYLRRSLGEEETGSI